MSPGLQNQFLRPSDKQNLPPVNHNEPVAYGLYILDDMCGKQYQLILRCLGEKITETDTLFRIQADRRLI